MGVRRGSAIEAGGGLQPDNTTMMLAKVTFVIIQVSLPNGKRVHPYQRGRASITGFGLWLREIIETGRLVGVVTARLVGLLQFSGSNGKKQRGKQ
jgi:hypothetical protein